LLILTSAVQHFPRVLELVPAHAKAGVEYRTRISMVPSWVFIPWIAQMVALLDKPECEYVGGVLLWLAGIF
jgi:hypothetical protein